MKHDYKIMIFSMMLLCMISCFCLSFFFTKMASNTYTEISCTLIETKHVNDRLVGTYEGTFHGKTYTFESNHIQTKNTFYVDFDYPKHYHEDDDIWKNGLSVVSQICIYIGLICFLLGIVFVHPLENTKFGTTLHIISIILIFCIFTYYLKIHHDFF